MASFTGGKKKKRGKKKKGGNKKNATRGGLSELLVPAGLLGLTMYAQNRKNGTRRLKRRRNNTRRRRH